MYPIKMPAGMLQGFLIELPGTPQHLFCGDDVKLSSIFTAFRSRFVNRQKNT
jgi:hypothetical protein